MNNNTTRRGLFAGLVASAAVTDTLSAADMNLVAKVETLLRSRPDQPQREALEVLVDAFLEFTLSRKVAH